MYDSDKTFGPDQSRSSWEKIFFFFYVHVQNCENRRGFNWNSKNGFVGRKLLRLVFNRTTGCGSFCALEFSFDKTLRKTNRFVVFANIDIWLWMNILRVVFRQFIFTLFLGNGFDYLSECISLGRRVHTVQKNNNERTTDTPRTDEKQRTKMYIYVFRCYLKRTFSTKPTDDYLF